ncbi:hypothetical protein HZC31_08570 [Candidatus Woesearchaeota archaeon]|nr:hypothetical protein [Candidatus Woesearchaeota archaeon]
MTSFLTTYPAKELVCRVQTLSSINGAISTTNVYAVPTLRAYVIQPDPSSISGVRITELKPLYELVYEDETTPQPPSSRAASTPMPSPLEQIAINSQPKEETSGCLSVLLPVVAIPSLSLALMYAYLSLTH